MTSIPSRNTSFDPRQQTALPCRAAAALFALLGLLLALPGLLLALCAAMASAELAIAKTALTASLGRAQVDVFFPLFTSTLAQCSRPNVQKCKVWIVDNVAHSQARTATLARYFAALSKSLEDGSKDGQKPSLKRRRLHILYVVSDALHHVVSRQKNRSFGPPWEASLPKLFANAAAFDKAPKQIKKLEELVTLWQEQGYFSQEVIAKLRDVIALGTAAASSAPDLDSSAAPLKRATEAPYVLPSFHGDHSTPWHDLPAGTWLPHLTPNDSRPLKPERIQPLQLKAGPADAKLVDAVKSLLADANRIYTKEKSWDDDPSVDVNELGERIVIDEITGDIIGGETYYGWSYAFCQKMKARRKKGGKSPQRRRSYSRSRSGSRSRSPSRPRSTSRGSAPSFKRRRMSSRSRSRSYSPTPSRSRSRSPRRPQHRDKDYSRSRSRSRSRSPAPKDGPWQSGPASGALPPPPPPPPSAHPHPHGLYPPIPPPPYGNLAVPPPTGFRGSWPPPPPPPPPTGQVGPPAWLPEGIPMPHLTGGWAGSLQSQQPPPPPPPPNQQQYQRQFPPPPPPQSPYAQQQQQQQQQQQPYGHHGRGNGNGSWGSRGRGRGAYDRGGYRGRGW